MKKAIVFLLLISLTFSGLIAQDKISRIEPPNWWAGMNNPELQLLVYGDDIASLSPVINYEGVEITTTVRTPNPNYIFVYLNIAADVKPGKFDIRFEKDGKLVESHSYALWEREEGSAMKEGFNTSDVMYLITPDRFANGDPGNDNIEGMKEKANRSFKGGRHGGDIEGIRKNLDYIHDMGFTAIWLNPVLENDMYDYSYHGYAATDFYNVDRRYGTNEDYLKMSKEAKSKGIKLIMDMIVNHCGSEHWFVLDPPTADWINFGGEYVNTNHRKHTVQDIHASEYDKKHFSDGWFVRTMPDMNQRNELMADYLIVNTIWWVEYVDLAGIRMDTYPYPDKDFMSRWTCEVMAEYPNLNIVGEEWNNSPAIVSYWQADKVNHDGYTSCLPSLMDFPLQAAVKESFNNPEKQYGSGMIQMYEMLAFDFLYPDPDNLVVFPDNHDMDRFYTQVNEDVDLFKMGMAYFLTMRGVPQIYYGSEVLMKNAGAPGDHGIIRSDFPGGWEGDKINGFTGEGLSGDQKDVQTYVKTLLNWRKDNKVIHNGKLMQFVPVNGVYVFVRYTDEGKVLVLLNKSMAPAEVDMARFSEITEGYSEGKDVITSKVYTLQGKATFPAKTAVVLELK
ncbi:MAG: alpha-amlyase [Bacteroidetes bacterium]|nr:MAG: alpha-amlyase [Bacteroidota bacterium]